jgi:predicted esterase
MNPEHVQEGTRNIAGDSRLALLAMMIGLYACGSNPTTAGSSLDAAGIDLRGQRVEVSTSGKDAGLTPWDAAATPSDAPSSSLDPPGSDALADSATVPDLGLGRADSSALRPETAAVGTDAVVQDLAGTIPDTRRTTDLTVPPPDTATPRSDAVVLPETAPQPDTARDLADPPPTDTAQPPPDAPIPDAAVPDASIPDTRPPAPDGTTLPRLPSSTGPGTFTISGRATGAIEVVVPTNLGPSPPLVISFHPTGGTQADGISQFELETKAVDHGFIVVSPRAGYRNGQHPADVDHDLNEGDSSWNMWDMDPATNEDLRYIAALIDAAQQTYGVDTSRVYTMGFSNGAFFAYFVAAALPSRIAGFAENSGGWTSDECPARYGPNSSYVTLAAPAGIGVGDSFACSVLFADADFPSSCRTSATNHLRPPSPGTRVPFGYLAHYSGDWIVSVQWSCILAEAMGSRAKTAIRYSDPDVWGGPGSVIDEHSVMPDFFDQAWAFFAGRTNTQ